eukprot:487895-Pyramimonas_sp.AAC.1
MEIIKKEPEIMTEGGLRELFETSDTHVKHLVLCGVRLIPKHHSWAHLTLSARSHGNPRTFSTFLDESLSGLAAVVARSCRPAQFEAKISSRLALMPILGMNKYFALV